MRDSALLSQFPMRQACCGHCSRHIAWLYDKGAVEAISVSMHSRLEGRLPSHPSFSFRPSSQFEIYLVHSEGHPRRGWGADPSYRPVSPCPSVGFCSPMIVAPSRPFPSDQGEPGNEKVRSSSVTQQQFLQPYRVLPTPSHSP